MKQYEENAARTWTKVTHSRQSDVGMGRLGEQLKGLDFPKRRVLRCF
jgi:hypothetical protein